MVDVPTLDDTKESAIDAGKAGLAAALGHRLGSNVAGPLGGAVGAAAGGSAVGGTEGQAAVTVAMYDTAQQLMTAPNPQNAGNSGAGDI